MLPDTLSTTRLELRPFRFADVPAFYAYLQEPELGRYLEGTGKPPTREQTAHIIARNIMARPEERGVWVITMEQELIGAITINFEKDQRVAEIGYSVKKSRWGQGIATEAAKAVVDTAFENLPELQRIQAGIHPDNAGSIRAAAKAGLAYESTLRAYSFVNGEVTDEVICAILRREWAAQEPKR